MSCTEQPCSGHPWVPLLELGHGAWLGLLSGTLFVGVAEGPQREVDLSEPIGLLPVLERTYSVVVGELQDREIELSMPSGSLTSSVPLVAIPIAAAQSKNNYWADLALSWLDEMPRSDQVIQALDALENAAWAGQSVRHRARRIRRTKG
jgi:hypothetical protein